jgi:hypothetical protein
MPITPARCLPPLPRRRHRPDPRPRRLGQRTDDLHGQGKPTWRQASASVDGSRTSVGEAVGNPAERSSFFHSQGGGFHLPLQRSVDAAALAGNAEGLRTGPGVRPPSPGPPGGGFVGEIDLSGGRPRSSSSAQVRRELKNRQNGMGQVSRPPRRPRTVPISDIPELPQMKMRRPA